MKPSDYTFETFITTPSMEACKYVALNISSGANQTEGEINKILALRELL